MLCKSALTVEVSFFSRFDCLILFILDVNWNVLIVTYDLTAYHIHWKPTSTSNTLDFPVLNAEQNDSWSLYTTWRSVIVIEDQCRHLIIKLDFYSYKLNSCRGDNLICHLHCLQSHRFFFHLQSTFGMFFIVKSQRSIVVSIENL